MTFLLISRIEADMYVTSPATHWIRFDLNIHDSFLHGIKFQPRNFISMVYFYTRHDGLGSPNPMSAVKANNIYATYQVHCEDFGTLSGEHTSRYFKEIIPYLSEVIYYITIVVVPVKQPQSSWVHETPW